jgi:hypothetical protein
MNISKVTVLFIKHLALRFLSRMGWLREKTAIFLKLLGLYYLEFICPIDINVVTPEEFIKMT